MLAMKDYRTHTYIASYVTFNGFREVLKVLDRNQLRPFTEYLTQDGYWL